MSRIFIVRLQNVSSRLAILAGILLGGNADNPAVAQPGRRGPPGGIQVRFLMMDRDGDGAIDSREFRGPRQRFRQVDTNHDGKIDLREFLAGANPGTTSPRAGRQTGNQSAPGDDAGSGIGGVLAPVPFIDCHDHLAGWSQDAGSKTVGESVWIGAAKSAVKVMDQIGARVMLLMPTPQTVGQEHAHKIEDLLPVLRKWPDRFAFMAGGGTLDPMIQQAVKAGDVTPELRQAFEQRARDLIRMGAAGFGEMTAEHLSMNPHHPYISAPPDHPLFLRLAELSGELDVPIDLHMEAITANMDLPERLRKNHFNPQRLQANIPAFERLLRHDRRAKIIWVHAGWDNTGCWTTQLSSRLLSTHPNLLLEIRIAPMAIPSRPLDQTGQLKQEWLDLLLKFPDRFLVGSDEFFFSSGPDASHPSRGSAAGTAAFLGALPKNLARQIGVENPLRVFRIKQ